MDATIAICTWNRAKLLDQTLERMRSLCIPTGLSWEIVVVNNRCTDETDAVIARHSGLLPIRRIFEEQQGLSHARNAAIRAARGELLLWTDDDVLVDANWLAEMTSAARRQPDLAFFGGPIEPWFEVTPPAWLLNTWREFSIAYAVRDFGAEPLEFGPQRLPFGANYAIRREVQLRYPYNARLGRSGTGCVGGEETDVLLRMLAGGHRGIWVPAAKVRHFLPQERLTLDYLRRYFQGAGQMECLPHAARSKPTRPAPATLLKTWLQLVCQRSVEAVLAPWPGLRTRSWAKAVVRGNLARGRLSAWNAA
jgi:glycosyltransferase involved in cell wall biosynthesis